MNYIATAFSTQMVPERAIVSIHPCTPEEVPQDCVSCIGHASTAAVASQLLGWTVEASRVSIQLNPGDSVYVAQYRGPRLEEGVTVLPAGASITFERVELVDLSEVIKATEDPSFGSWGENEFAQLVYWVNSQLHKLAD